MIRVAAPVVLQPGITQQQLAPVQPMHHHCCRGWVQTAQEVVDAEVEVKALLVDGGHVVVLTLPFIGFHLCTEEEQENKRRKVEQINELLFKVLLFQGIRMTRHAIVFESACTVLVFVRRLEVEPRFYSCDLETMHRSKRSGLIRCQL